MCGEVVTTIDNIIITCEMKRTYHIVDTVDSEDDKNDEEYWTGSLLQVGLHHHIRVTVVYGDVCRIMQSLIEACSLLSLSLSLSLPLLGTLTSTCMQIDSLGSSHGDEKTDKRPLEAQEILHTPS